MKIALISPDDLSTLIFCKTFSRILHEEHQAEVYTISPVDMYREELKEIESIHFDVPMARWLSPHRDLFYMFRLYSILRKGRFDQVVTFTTKPNVYGVVAARMAGVPHITLAVRGLGQMFNAGKKIKHRFFHTLVKKMYSVSCRLADNIWFTNKNDLTYFAQQKIVQREKSFLTKNAVDLSQFSMDAVPQGAIQELREELNISERDQVVIMVARLIWSKGVREFAESAQALLQRFPRLHFLLVAPAEEGSAESVPESYIREMEGHSNLKWLGFRKDVRNLYALADLSVLPSYYKEGGYPRALLEAMALQKPVIAADTEDCKGPVDDGSNGYIVKPKSSHALTEAIGEIFENNDRREAFGRHSLEKMYCEFDDQVVVREVLSHIIQSR